jgi:transglutaminase-like putative cysteine protease
MVGFSDKVDLGGVGKLRSDPTIVLRVEVPNLPADPPPRLALYLKGPAFDRYDGTSWSRSQPPSRTPAEQRGHSVRLLRYPQPGDRKLRIDLEPIDPQVVFLPIDAVAMTLVTPVNAAPALVPELFTAPEGGLTYRTPDERGLRYEVSLAGSKEDVPLRPLGADAARYLALPSNLPVRIHELAREWTRGVTDAAEQARLIETRLRRDYRYDLDSPSGATKNPLDHFLFVSKRGHCEFYSTAMAVLLRSLGVPTRNATGFIGGSYNRFSRNYAVRQGDAHSWVEVYLPNRGWTRFDPTPPASSAPRSEIHGLFASLRDIVEALGQRWNHHVVNYDLKQQIGLLRSARNQYRDIVSRSGVVGKALGSPRRAALALLGLAGLAWVARYWMRRRRGTYASKPSGTQHDVAARRIVELYRSLELALAARGVPRPSGTPPLKHAEALAGMGHPIAHEVVALTEQYQSIRFGGEPLDDSVRRDFAERVRAIKLGHDEAAAS